MTKHVHVVAASRFTSTLALALMVAGCAVGPDYVRPDIAVAESWGAVDRLAGGSGVGVDGDGANAPSDGGRASVTERATHGESLAVNRGWVPALPGHDAVLTNWWTLFGDPTLDTMMQNVLAANFDLAQAEAVFRQSQATLRATRAGLFPTLGTSASVTRSGSGRSGSGAGFSGGESSFSGGGGSVSEQYALSGTVSWEIDLWGRIRRSVEADQAGVVASAADLAMTRLSLQSTLAQTYFQLWAMDEEARLLDQTVQAYERSLQLTQNQLDVGVATPADVAAATTQLENARAQRQSLVWRRSQLEHTLATLQGLAPSTFSLNAAADLPLVLPDIPVGVPARLLQRRPDVAAAESRVRQANASIGVAQAAWFPDLTLSAQGGFRSGEWAQWLSAPARFWSLGPALAMTLFDAGARSARVEQARAAYDAQAAAYRQSVLNALREVEDVLVQLDSLARETEIQDRALQAARQSLALTRNQYEAGLIDYLSVVQVETAALNAERAALTLKSDRLQATVQLITALGGGWDDRALYH